MKGEKMSKSLGNGALVSEVTKQFPPRAVRLYLLAPHYRSIIEFSPDSLAEATAQLARIDSFVARATEATEAAATEVPQEFAASMNDDLGTPGAMAVLFTTVRQGNAALESGDQAEVGRLLGEVRAMLAVLGLATDDPVWAEAAGGQGGDDLTPIVDGLVQALLAQRASARERKDWSAADAIRDQLNELGLKITDTPAGAKWELETGH
ncbi:MAG: cysteine--tRNA ligase, partial [Propionibacteriaceae bacterium]|nr:cysteine--tRNA ligase [Propionibacteriaceae bacterium]